MKRPRYSLDRIKALVASGQVYIARRRGLDFFPSPRAAYAFVRRVVPELSVEANFAETTRLAVDVADVYAIHLDGRGWYLKVYIDEAVPEASFISVHPLERRIQTNGGTVEP